MYIYIRYYVFIKSYTFTLIYPNLINCSVKTVRTFSLFKRVTQVYEVLTKVP